MYNAWYSLPANKSGVIGENCAGFGDVDAAIWRVGWRVARWDVFR